jgi:GntR family transcriptional regulator
MTQHWDSDTPIYVQLYQTVVKRILDGNLKEGEALPSVRNVAAEYQLNPVTISKAYQMLQDQQIVEKQRGIGLFIVGGVKEKILARERASFLTEEWPRILQQIDRLQLSVEQLLMSTMEGK